MRIKYRQQHNNRRRFSQLILLVIVAIVVVAILALTKQLNYVTKYLYVSALSGASSVSDTVAKVHNTMTPKSTLLKQNQDLRTSLQKAKVSLLYNQSLAIENQRLRALLGTAIGTSRGTSAQTGLTARIIDYKSAPYGTIILRALDGAEAKLVRPGDIAHFGSLAIGKVERVDRANILVKLFTASGESYSVLVGDTVATLSGSSNGTGKVVLSRTQEVTLGTTVSLPYANGLVIGSVEEIEREAEDSMQVLLIRTPIAINQLHFISISHGQE